MPFCNNVMVKNLMLGPMKMRSHTSQKQGCKSETSAFNLARAPPHPISLQAKLHSFHIVFS